MAGLAVGLSVIILKTGVAKLHLDDKSFPQFTIWDMTSYPVVQSVLETAEKKTIFLNNLY